MCNAWKIDELFSLERNKQCIARGKGMGVGDEDLEGLLMPGQQYSLGFFLLILHIIPGASFVFKTDLI